MPIWTCWPKARWRKTFSRDFDRYWASGSSYPFFSIAPRADAEKGRLKLHRSRRDDAEIRASYLDELAASPLAAAISEGNVPWRYADARLISDDPAKGLARDKELPAIADSLLEALGKPEKDVFIVSPYFVPSKWGMAALRDLTANNVKVTVFNQLPARHRRGRRAFGLCALPQRPAECGRRTI